MSWVRVIVRRIEVAISVRDTTWKWCGWAADDPDHDLRDYRNVFAHVRGTPSEQVVVGWRDQFGEGEELILSGIENLVGQTLDEVQGVRDPGGKLIWRGQHGPVHHQPFLPIPTLPEGPTEREAWARSNIKVRRMLLDVENGYEGETVRIYVNERGGASISSQLKAVMPAHLTGAMTFVGEHAHDLASKYLALHGRRLSQLPTYEEAVDRCDEEGLEFGHRRYDPDPQTYFLALGESGPPIDFEAYGLPRPLAQGDARRRFTHERSSGQPSIP